METLRCDLNLKQLANKKSNKNYYYTIDTTTIDFLLSIKHTANHTNQGLGPLKL